MANSRSLIRDCALSWLADFFALRDWQSLLAGGVDLDLFPALVLSLELLRDFVDFLLLDRDVSDPLLFLCLLYTSPSHRDSCAARMTYYA